jgi:hypothetical protein
MCRTSVIINVIVLFVLGLLRTVNSTVPIPITRALPLCAVPETSLYVLKEERFFA